MYFQGLSAFSPECSYQHHLHSASTTTPVSSNHILCLDSHFVTGFTFCDRIHILWQDSHFVSEFTFCDRIHILCLNSHFVTGFTFCDRIHILWLDSRFVTGFTLQDSHFVSGFTFWICMDCHINHGYNWICGYIGMWTHTIWCAGIVWVHGDCRGVSDRLCSFRLEIIINVFVHKCVQWSVVPPPACVWHRYSSDDVCV